VITGKKGFGLWRDQWSDGIVECSFSKEEIMNEFSLREIEIPAPLLKEFDDFIWKKKLIKFEKELNSLRKNYFP
jgi:hypothetical protein